VPPAHRRAEAEPADEAVIPLHKPKLVVAHGRGGSGKSTGTRFLVERAHLAGREIVIADADPRATLRTYFSDVVQPSHTEEVVVSEWLDALINAQAEKPMTIILDRNGGDQIFGRFAMSLALSELLASISIMPVALHWLGPDLEDVADLQRAEASGAFCPEATVLVLNAGTIKDTRPANDAFAGVRAHPAYKAAIDRGAREIVFPRLPCIAAVNALRVPFGAAETDSRLGLTDRQRVAMWRRAAEQALAPVAMWLP
jgi:hypothetical protein